MPRKARIDTLGALHHIIVRGIERRKIFYDDHDRDNFLEGTRELGMTTVELAKKLNLAQPTISQSVMRGRKIAEDEGLKLLEQINQ